jgi:hypothetical protein
MKKKMVMIMMTTMSFPKENVYALCVGVSLRPSFK